MKALLLKGTGQYGALRLHIDQAAGAFQELGIETEIVDFANQQNLDFTQYIGRDFSLIFSINIGSDIRVMHRSLGQTLGVPHFIMYVDHPSDQRDRLKATTSDQINAFIDIGHARWFNTMHPGQAAGVCVMTPGANKNGEAPEDVSIEDFIAKRDIPILFTGTVRHQSEPSWRQRVKTDTTRVLDAAYELCLSNNSLPLDYALRRAVVELFGKGVDDSIIKQILPVATLLHNQIHSVRRYSALCALADADIPLWVLGKGWEQYMDRFKSFTYKGEGTFEETLNLLKRTRIALHTNTNFVEGGHERIFAAQAAGAAVLSDHSSWLDRRYVNNQNIVFYQWQPSLNISERASTLISDPEISFKVAKAGQAQTLANHTWTCRVAEILEVCKQTAVWRETD